MKAHIYILPSFGILPAGTYGCRTSVGVRRASQSDDVSSSRIFLPSTGRKLSVYVHCALAPHRIYRNNTTITTVVGLYTALEFGSVTLQLAACIMTCLLPHFCCRPLLLLRPWRPAASPPTSRSSTRCSTVSTHQSGPCSSSKSTKPTSTKKTLAS